METCCCAGTRRPGRASQAARRGDARPCTLVGSPRTRAGDLPDRHDPRPRCAEPDHGPVGRSSHPANRGFGLTVRVRLGRGRRRRYGASRDRRPGGIYNVAGDALTVPEIAARLGKPLLTLPAWARQGRGSADAADLMPRRWSSCAIARERTAERVGFHADAHERGRPGVPRHASGRRPQRADTRSTPADRGSGALEAVCDQLDELFGASSTGRKAAAAALNWKVSRSSRS